MGKQRVVRAGTGKPTLSPNRFSWKRRIAAGSVERWMEALDFLGPQRVMTLHNAGSSSAQVMALGLSDAEADVLVEVFGGRRSEAAWLTVKDAPDRAPLKIRGKLLVVSTIKERDAWVKKSAVPVLWVPSGMAFGTGEHATTSMCLRHVVDEALERKRAGENWTMLDVGTGSGILAMAARVGGASKVTATDYDADAVAVTEENLAANGVLGVRVLKADILKKALPVRADVVAANLFSGILIEAVATISAAVNTGGRLILSGILRDQEVAVREAYVAKGLRHDRTVRKGKWVSIVLRASSEASR
jgi:ribosomal protein L11 methyltransferase